MYVCCDYRLYNEFDFVSCCSRLVCLLKLSSFPHFCLFDAHICGVISYVIREDSNVLLAGAGSKHNALYDGHPIYR